MQQASERSRDDEMTARRLLHREEGQAIVLGAATRAAGEGPRKGIEGVRRQRNRGRHAGDTTRLRVCEPEGEPAVLAAIAGTGTQQRAPCIEPCARGRWVSSC